MTEPQKIDGTTLGFSIYPYHFSFQDKIKDKSSNQKLVIYKLKNSEFIEPECKVFEEKFASHLVPRNHVERLLKEFVVANPQYVQSKRRAVEFFNYSLTLDKNEEEVKNL